MERSTNKKGRRKSGSESSRNWSELPVDILSEIFKNTSFIDRIFFRAVCRNWNSVSRIPFVHHNGLPLLMRYEITNYTNAWVFTSKLTYNPRYSTVRGPSYIAESTGNTSDNIGEHRRNKFLCTSKGWMLLQDGVRLLLFCPFNNKTIKLPLLETAGKEKIHSFNTMATLSGTPDQPSDCTVFLVEDAGSMEVSRLNIRTCRCNESSWRMCSVNIPQTFHISTVAYNEPMLYCLSSRGVLGAFDPINNEWAILNESPPTNNNDRIHLVESDNGELMMVAFYRSNFNMFQVFSFDFSESAWKPKRHIGSRVIYAQYQFPNWPAFSLTVEGREAMHLANKSFYHYFEYSGCYSLENGHNEEWSDHSLRTAKNTGIWIEPPKIF